MHRAIDGRRRSQVVIALRADLEIDILFAIAAPRYLPRTRGETNAIQNAPDTTLTRQLPRAALALHLPIAACSAALLERFRQTALKPP